MKLGLGNAALILLAGMIIVLTGVFLNTSQKHVSNPIILAGLLIEFLGTIWLVLSLNQRRRKHRL
ncbi:hypothetical protein [Dyadobacter sp.]|uniref:hypothetical protein n=1 Tax=Dyadobacter sp. TaxID=1914288 RepID=UPI003F70A49C